MTRKWDEGEHEGCGVDSQRAIVRHLKGCGSNEFYGWCTCNEIRAARAAKNTDIVVRLRAESAYQLPRLLTEAADEIERLRALTVTSGDPQTTNR